MRLRLLDKVFEEHLHKIEKDTNESIHQMSIRTYVAKVERTAAPGPELQL